MAPQAKFFDRPAMVTQRGQAMLLLVLLIAIGIGAALLTTTSSVSLSRSQKQARENEAVLTEVKAALIGWSAAGDPAADGTYARPGELPCPDVNPLDGYEDGSCVAGAIGRVPWKTLGIAEPKDAAGETLWYAISGAFRIYNMTNAPITSDTVGDLTVYQDSTATIVSNQAIAVLFAPGFSLGNQDRSAASTMACAAPSGTYPRNQCASNYLETWSGVNNATINGPFINTQASDTFNDRVLTITNADLMPAVEQRVAKELIVYLNRYRGATGVYPWADLGDGNSNASASPTPNYYNRNRFPCGNALPSTWSGAGITLPHWLTNGCGLPPTGWQGVIYYAAARSLLEAGGTNCTTCSTSTLAITNPAGSVAYQCTSAPSPNCALQVISAGSADLVLLTTGAQTTSRGPPGYTPNDWPIDSWSTISSNYFADSENRDNNDDNFVVPTSTNNNRNRLYIVR